VYLNFMYANALPRSVFVTPCSTLAPASHLTPRSFMWVLLVVAVALLQVLPLALRRPWPAAANACPLRSAGDPTCCGAAGATYHILVMF
jgi:hypothetical protein